MSRPQVVTRGRKPSTKAPSDATRVNNPTPREGIRQIERQVMAIGQGSHEVGDQDHHRSPVNNFARGVALELGNAAAAPFALLAKGLDAASHKPEEPNVHRFEAPVSAQKLEMERTFAPEGNAGRAGRLVGFVAGELPYYVMGGKEIEAGLKAAGEISEAGSVWKRLNRAAEIAEEPYAKSMIRNPAADVAARTLGAAVTSMPTAAALGIANTPQGENVLPNALLSAATWGAAGLASEPVMEVGARGIAKAIKLLPEHQARTGVRLGLAEAARRIPEVRSLLNVGRLDDYLKYDAQDRFVNWLKHAHEVEAQTEGH